MTDYIIKAAIIPATQSAFLSKICEIKESKNHQEAARDPKWIETMNSELEALEKNNTWRITSLPPGKHAITLKWVYRIKYTPTEEVGRYKARLVARGIINSIV